MAHQLPNDLLYQILLRLPVKSIFRFKSVSKDWNRLISHHQFCCQYLTWSKDAPWLLLGFFQFDRKQSYLSFSFLPTCYQGLPLNSPAFNRRVGYYYASSGGLILCGHHPSNYYVWNPITDKWFKLPRPTTQPCFTRFYTIGLYCEQQLDYRRYKVVRAKCTKYGINIETYSSVTGVWRESKIIGPSGIMLSTTDLCLAIKGTFFWNTYCEKIAAYDPDTAEDRFWLITVPPIHRPSCIPILAESPDGRLQCVVYDDVDYRFEIYVLAKKLSCYSYSATLEVSDWNLNNTVRVTADETWTISRGFRSDSWRLVAFHPHNSEILYLRVWDYIYVYDTGSGRVNLVPYNGTLFDFDMFSSDIFPYFLPEWPLSPLP